MRGASNDGYFGGKYENEKSKASGVTGPGPGLAFAGCENMMGKDGVDGKDGVCRLSV